MPPCITPVPDRLRRDIAACPTRDAIEEACRHARHEWRRRVLDPATTIDLFLLQPLHRYTACTHVVHFGGRAFAEVPSSPPTLMPGPSRTTSRRRASMAVDRIR